MKWLDTLLVGTQNGVVYFLLGVVVGTAVYVGLVMLVGWLADDDDGSGAE